MEESTALDYCKITNRNNLSGIRVSDDAASCIYTCEPGWAFEKARGPNGEFVRSVSGTILFDGVYQDHTETDVCSYPLSGVCDYSQVSGVNAGIYRPGTGACMFTCESGYYVEGTATDVCADGMTTGCGTGQTGFLSETGRVGNIVAQTGCVPAKFVVSYECGGMGTLNTTKYDGVTGANGEALQIVNYGSGFRIPETLYCEKPGYSFRGWNSDKTFNVDK